jgi:hypothetical protein
MSRFTDWDWGDCGSGEVELTLVCVVGSGAVPGLVLPVARAGGSGKSLGEISIMLSPPEKAENHDQLSLILVSLF